MDIRVGILTSSDRSARSERPDLSGEGLRQAVLAQGWQVVRQTILPDEFTLLSQELVEWADSGEIDIILTTGGTGFAPRDIIPEATQAVIERATPGLTEAMRAASLKITPHAMLSRAIAGIRKQTLIINLPGSPKGALENLEAILSVLPHAVQLLRNAPEAEAGHKI
jgi:molybdopterin adenylyltransferase